MKPMREDLMVQQQVKTVWQHMVGVMCLNLTYRKQVKEILPKLFKKYPNPNNQPQKKNALCFLVFFFIKKIKNKLRDRKLIINKLKGGKLKELIAPRNNK